MFKLVCYSTLILLAAIQCSPKHRDLDAIKKSGTLRVLTINSETTYYENRDGQGDGLEYVMAKDFADFLNVKLQVIVKDSVAELFDSLKAGRGDLIAATISKTEKRKENWLFGPSYQTEQQQLVCQKKISPKTLTDLQKFEVVVGVKTSYHERLIQLAKEYEGLSWRVEYDITTPELFKKIADGSIDCTIADSSVVKVYQRYFPELQVSLDIGSPQEVAWVFRPEQEELEEQVQLWFDKVKTRKLKKWKKDFYFFVKNFDPFDIRKLIERIESRLPKYENFLKQAAEAIGWEWTLLAAISYQESHWNPKAKSPTGVRGFMMLTRNTAKAMGVKNRLDPKASILGGARYLERLEKRVPSYIPYPDRKWMTLASYNVGFAHVRDARGVAAWQGENPNTWTGLREVLPLLSSKKIYKRLPHGYARGLEPVLYVSRIRNYHGVIKRELLRKGRL
jgi:membrane-bound lytic murein transglycosylase F